MYWKPTSPAGSQEVWEARRPLPDREPLSARPDARAHLVLLNGAADRTAVLVGVAGRLARQAGAAIRVAYLHDPIVADDPDRLQLFGPRAPNGTLVHECNRLYRAAAALTGRTGQSVRPELLVGSANVRLADYLRANAFDLVALAAEGTWLWAGGLWSQAARWRPVLVVGRRVTPAWADDSRSADEVLVVLDGTRAAEEAVPPALALCRRLDARLTLLRVAGPNRAGRSGEDCQRYLTDVARLIRRAGPAVRTVVGSGRPAAAVLKIQQATGAIVALAAPVRSWAAALGPGRLAVRLLQEATAPVLYYRPTP
jgi:nucleotide-binding universal stress UspA family protein